MMLHLRLLAYRLCYNLIRGVFDSPVFGPKPVVMVHWLVRVLVTQECHWQRRD